MTHRHPTWIVNEFPVALSISKVAVTIIISVAAAGPRQLRERSLSSHRVQSSQFCEATFRKTECPLWVKSGHRIRPAPCPLYPKKRTLELGRVMSALCQKRTSRRATRMSALCHSGHQNWPALLSAQQHRQLRDVGRNPSRFIAAE
jgi:hypothetical protein